MMMARTLFVGFLFILGSALLVSAQQPSSRTNIALGNSQSAQSPYFFTTKEYQQEALRVFVEEINHVASDLGLAERLPILPTNLVEIHIATPGSGMLGTISTSNYVYYARAERKFAGFDQRNLQQQWKQDRESYLWPTTRINTNGALNVAGEIMAAAGMDIAALNRDCKVDVQTTVPNELEGKYFVPDYFIAWSKPGKNVAFLVFLEPTKSIRILQVYDPAYILRKPVEISHLAEILRKGNAPKMLLDRMGLGLTNKE